MGYPVPGSGVCHGIANMARRAYLLEDYRTFLDRMMFIESLDEADIESLQENIDQVHGRRLALGRNPADERLDNKDRILLSLHVFLFGVALYQAPSKYPDIFLNSNKLMLQTGSITDIDNLLLDGYSDINDANRTPLLNLLLVTNQQKYLAQIFSHFEKFPAESVGLLVNSFNHAIFIHYQDGYWHLTNHSD